MILLFWCTTSAYRHLLSRVDTMEKLKFVLKIWTKLANNVRMRDRSIKILQYGCQMLLGFYANQFSQEVVQGLRITRSMASSSRKAFWMLKSFNHVHTAIIMIETYSHSADECYANLIDILEQLCLIVYYFYENLVFVARTKLVGFTEASLDWWGDWAWFFEDFTCFVAAALRTWIASRNLVLAESDRLRILDVAVPNGEHSNGNCITTPILPEGTPIVNRCNADTNSVNGQISQFRKGSSDIQIASLRRKYKDSLLTLAIAFFEVAAAAEAVDMWKKVFGVAIGDKGMGLCGVTSSVLILYEATANAVEAETTAAAPP